jgi:hypothetical protein
LRMASIAYLPSVFALLMFGNIRRTSGCPAFSFHQLRLVGPDEQLFPDRWPVLLQESGTRKA